ncbi:hypothetical protein GQ43DRAFT_454213 [Delitschia confertaspora ATCC 74209]|uniref:Protein LOT5 n=1 Tax=Delitschia confertaspora ATCC 74209 TaxID=1513339 RepID=A0A9P4JV57_9PLEO|nr:hypothetical protein GQ43DRAFT_454213 [Delitschia confertaspora ATCC 74209]
MALRVVEKTPALEDYTPLSEHQEQTPSTFFGGKPVLYARHGGLTLSAPGRKLQSHPAFARFSTSSTPSTVDGATAASGDVLIKDVEAWVNSEDLILFQQSPKPTGVSIPYPSIALHATMKWQSRVDALYMNLSLNDAEQVNDVDEIEVLEVTLLPLNFESADASSQNPIKEIFSAMNTCADLHPDPEASDSDPEFEDAEDDAPGAGGWITAENMHEFIDENGNFVGNGTLGAGAGSVRAREEDGANGADDNHESEERKWRRTE